MGAMSRLNRNARRSLSNQSWLSKMLERKPVMLVAIALANKMARQIWAMLTKNETYRDPFTVDQTQPFVNMAQICRAILLASAIATNITGLRSSILLSQLSFERDRRALRLRRDIAPIIKSRRMSCVVTARNARSFLIYLSND